MSGPAPLPSMPESEPEVPPFDPRYGPPEPEDSPEASRMVRLWRVSLLGLCLPNFVVLAMIYGGGWAERALGVCWVAIYVMHCWMAKRYVGAAYVLGQYELCTKMAEDTERELRRRGGAGNN